MSDFITERAYDLQGQVLLKQQLQKELDQCVEQITLFFDNCTQALNTLPSDEISIRQGISDMVVKFIKLKDSFELLRQKSGTSLYEFIDKLHDVQRQLSMSAHTQTMREEFIAGLKLSLQHDKDTLQTRIQHAAIDSPFLRYVNYVLPKLHEDSLRLNNILNLSLKIRQRMDDMTQVKEHAGLLVWNFNMSIPSVVTYHGHVSALQSEFDRLVRKGWNKIGPFYRKNKGIQVQSDEETHRVYAENAGVSLAALLDGTTLNREVLNLLTKMTRDMNL